jgi:pyruvate dehydrogenase E2 component (dihydrolipoamide acetyltransferase)
MVEVMTDKATVTIGAPKPGKVLELRAQEGDVVPVGNVLVVLDLEGGGDSQPAAPAEAAAPAPSAAPKAEAEPAQSNEGTAASAVGDIREELPGTSQIPSGYHNDKPLAAPATRKLARELDVDLRRVPPSGAAGRVTREDVERFAQSGGQSASAAAPAALPPIAVQASAEDRRVPIRGIRKRVFESMARSKRTAAHFTYVEECECTELIRARDKMKAFAEADGVKLNYLPFIIKAAVSALRRHPMLNTVVDEEKMEMVHKGTFDIGIAAATDAGLIVPVLRRADQLTLVEIAREIERLASEARAGKTRREDLGGSSFTITSLGKLGGIFATPVLNLPEVAILYIPEMKKVPVVKGNEVVVGHVMYPSLSFDHRIIDGHIGAAFAKEFVSYLEQPERLMLELR